MRLYEWQKVDPENKLVMCWFTHDSLDEIKKMDLTNKVILSFGAGLGDAWLAKRCKKLYVVERVGDWIIKAAEVCGRTGVNNVEYIYRPCNDSDGKEEYYCEIPEGVEPDVIMNDDAYRTEVVEMAIKHFKNKEGGGVLICDNYYQDYVWKSPKAVIAIPI